MINETIKIWSRLKFPRYDTKHDISTLHVFNNNEDDDWGKSIAMQEFWCKSQSTYLSSYLLWSSTKSSKLSVTQFNREQDLEIEKYLGDARPRSVSFSRQTGTLNKRIQIHRCQTSNYLQGSQEANRQMSFAWGEKLHAKLLARFHLVVIQNISQHISQYISIHKWINELHNLTILSL